MDAGVVLGRARIVLFVGMGAVVLGLGLAPPVVAWAGVALVAAAFTANAVVKVSHFQSLALTPERRTRLAATWVLLAAGVVALVAVAVAEQTRAAETDLFWPLLVVVAALAVAYRAFQSRYLDEAMGAAADDG